MKLESDLESLSKWLRDKLFLDTDKTKVMLVGTSARLRNVDNDDFHVKVYDNVLENVDNYK